eukprot:CAMPEP_0202872668 /NCGR_PEP_ID=MMETSP1391-20130828/21748_1 /ASSEMBLY_ACC=CAM_ASM_000867 /TAXON_ID=1034604 /ORGANISM="Chlamydomonas leiostraca, Strain SAG 11-49" /LENGTH=59 /DNA_ID=CAMNT_0049553769 /DNA_START=128 /DNA_END=304 /DNA_ORIENTATION=+
MGSREGGQLFQAPEMQDVFWSGLLPMHIMLWEGQGWWAAARGASHHMHILQQQRQAEVW